MNDQEERLVRAEMEIRRLQSDFTSEKGTHSRASDRVHKDIADRHKIVEERLDRLHAEIVKNHHDADQKVEDFKVVIDARMEKLRAERTSWFERVFWIFAGAVLSAAVTFLLSARSPK